MLLKLQENGVVVIKVDGQGFGHKIILSNKGLMRYRDRKKIHKRVKYVLNTNFDPETKKFIEQHEVLGHPLDVYKKVKHITNPEDTRIMLLFLTALNMEDDIEMFKRISEIVEKDGVKYVEIE